MGKPNILLIVMDTARASSAYSETPTVVMPNLYSIAEEGVKYENAVTNAPWTLPSHASIFSGQYTSNHQTHAGYKQFDPDNRTLPEILKNIGYQTVAISNNSWISPKFGFGNGFDEFFLGIEPLQGGADLSDVARLESAGDHIRSIYRKLDISNAFPTLVNALYSRYLYKWYDKGALVANWRIKRWFKYQWNSSDPFFMFVNYLEPHLKYDPPKSFRYQYLPADISRAEADSVSQKPWEFIAGNLDMTERDFSALEALYKGELAYLDYRIGQLYEFLDDFGILDDTIIIITSDHGENLGEHHLMDHQYCLYNTLLNIPLVVRYPSELPMNRSDLSLVELRDLYPSIINIVSPDTVIPGSSSKHILPGLESQSTLKQRDVAISEYLVPQPSIETLADRSGSSESELEHFNCSLRAIQSNEWKYIEGSGGRQELYSIQSDPNESTNVIDEEPEIAKVLRDRLKSEVGDFAIKRRNNTTEEDDKISNHLRDLGYL